MCYWKQWRRCCTKVRELVKLGTSLRTAISVGLSRKGPWHLARTLATQTGMTNQWLAEQGLVSVKELWVNIHYPATAEPPGADPHARWCGGWGLKTPRLPDWKFILMR
jgi:RNA-directed DNA polymerase